MSAGPLTSKLLDQARDTLPERADVRQRLTPERVEWGRTEAELRMKDWQTVHDRACGRAKAAGLTDEQAAEAVREAIALGLTRAKEKAAA